MKRLLIAATLAVTTALVYAGEMKGMEMKGEMKGMDMSRSDKAPVSHKAVGVVKKIDAKTSTVTLAHEPVKTMNWPAMTMAFQVKDKALLDKFSEGKKVEVEFQKQGTEHVITSVK